MKIFKLLSALSLLFISGLVLSSPISYAYDLDFKVVNCVVDVSLFAMSKVSLPDHSFAMKLVDAFTGVTEKKEIEIESKIQRLIIKKSAAYTTETVNVLIKRSTGGEDVLIIPVCPFPRIRPAAGFIKSANVCIAGVYYSIIDLAPASIDLEPGDKIVVNLTNLVGAATYQVNVWGSDSLTKDVYRYQTDTIAAGKYTKQINVSNMALMTILRTNLVDITFSPIRGIPYKMTLEDLDVMDVYNMSFGDLTIGAAAADNTYGFLQDSYLVLNVSQLKSVDITTDAAADVPFLTVSGQRY